MISTTEYGVFLEVFNRGVMLTGASGIGKSELALGLINRGHKLIADDSVEFYLDYEGSLTGRCPALLQDFLEVRGLGPLNIRALYGETAIKATQHLYLIIQIKALEQEEIINIDRLRGMYTQKRILGISIPEVTVPVAAGRNLGILVECAVRNQILKTSGYDASEELLQRHHQLLSHNKPGEI